MFTSKYYKILFFILLAVSFLIILSVMGWIVPEPLSKSEKTNRTYLYQKALKQRDKFYDYLTVYARNNDLTLYTDKSSETAGCHDAGDWVSNHQTGRLEHRCEVMAFYQLSSKTIGKHEAILYKYSDNNLEHHSLIPLVRIDTYDINKKIENKYVQKEADKFFSNGAVQFLQIYYQDDFSVGFTRASIGLRWDKFFR